MINFLTNALKFCDSKDITTTVGTYTTVQQDGNPVNKLLVSVTDQGKGLSKEEQAQLFKTPFTKLDDPHNLNPTGTGMGLYICSKIVKALGGEIWVSSNSNGVGCTFGFKVPIQYDASQEL